jgi:hypothetical protein
MKKPNPSYIQVTKDFQPVVDTFATLLYEKTILHPPGTKAEFVELVYQTFNQVLFPADLDSAKLKYNELKLQFTKSGPLGETSYAAPIERQDYARRKPAKPYQSTLARVNHQNRIKSANTAWNSANAELKSIWNNAAIAFDTTPKLDGINLFRGVYISLLVDNQPIPDPFIPTDELLRYYHAHKSS